MEKLEKLQSILREIGQGVVAFSGGCDSAFLLQVASDVLGDRVMALTAVSPSIAPWERQDAENIGKLIGVSHLFVESHEMQKEEYRENPINRCFFCKDELYSVAWQEAQKRGLGVVMDGSNLDDLGDHRPGRDAAKKHGVRSPLEEAGFTKKEVREWSKNLGLPTWNKPAVPCLASRFPYGTQISENRIEQVMRAESILRDFGFRLFRARYHETILRIEVDPSEFDDIMKKETRERIVSQCKELGFLYVTLDLQGFRSGSLNEVLASK